MVLVFLLWKEAIAVLKAPRTSDCLEVIFTKGPGPKQVLKDQCFKQFLKHFQIATRRDLELATHQTPAAVSPNIIPVAI